MSDYPVVLYVEDDSSSREIMEFLLLYDIGLSQVTIWENSADFQIKMEQLASKPDIIFLDIHMKPYSGFEMLEILRQMDDYRDTPIIAMTASVMNEEVQTLKDHGFDGAIGKPIDQLSFPDMLNKILKGERIWRITS